MTYNDFVDEDFVDEEEELPDIILSHAKRDYKNGYKTPVNEKTDWWYVYGEPSGVDVYDVPYLGYKEGICISIQTPNKNYNITLSTEVIRDMYATIVERIIYDANEDAGIHIDQPLTYEDAADVSTYKDVVFADNPVGYWSFNEKELEEVE